jgi:NAD(P)-dependent dehydrogenase (short-subunit alcohol dehydrogenase family)
MVCLPNFALEIQTNENMTKQVVILLGTGSIGQAIARRIGAGKHVVLADYREENAQTAAMILENAGFETSTVQADLASRESIKNMINHALQFGEITNLINAAGVSPSQAPVNVILKTDLYGTAVLLEEVGKVIAEGGSGVVISSQSGHRLGNIPQEQSDQLAMMPTEKLMSLPFLNEISDTLKAYQYSKRCNVLRVMSEASRWSKRGATINSISPGIIITPLANDELHGPRKDGYLKMIQASPAGRAGTPDEVGDLAEFLMSSRGRFISGADFLIDGGTTASYWYGDLQYLKVTH